MKNFLPAFLFFLCTLATTIAFGQGEISFSELTTGVSASPLSGGTPNVAIFGIQVDKAGGATSSLSSITINLSSDPAGKFTNPRLFASTNNSFGPADNAVGGLTISTTATTFVFAGAISAFGSSSGAVTRYYFIVVDVDPAADGTTPSIAPSITEAEITAGTTVNANTINGTTYSFTGITPNITNVGPGSSTCVGETITITGTGFSTPSVTINMVPVSINTSNATQIEITAPGDPGVIGTYPIVVTNSNGNSGNSSNYTIKPVLDNSIPVNPSKLNPLPNENFTINVGTGTQTGVDYRVRRISPTSTGYSAAQGGNGGTLNFGPYSHNPAVSETYVYEVQATSTGCGSITLTQTATVIVAALSVNAGMDVTICEGEGIVLGGSPSVFGGSGFYNIEWTSNPPGFISNETNPAIVPPLGVNTYTLSVTDSDGNTDSEDVIVTVQGKTDPADLTINFNPNEVTVENDAPPVLLSFTSNDPGSGTFSGNGVNPDNNKFYPNAAPLGENDITLNFTNANNCVTTISRTINVYDPNSFLSVLEPFYCPVGVENLDIVVPAGFGYQDITLANQNGINIPTGLQWTKNNITRKVQLQLANLPQGKNLFTIIYTYTYISSYVYNYYFDISCFCIKTIVTPVYSVINIPVRVPLTINTPPATEVKTEADALCRNNAPITVAGRPFGGVWLGPGISPVSDNGTPTFSPGETGLAEFDPAVANIGINSLRYVFEDTYGCRDTTYFEIEVFNVPTVNFAAGNGCVGVPLPFSPSSNVPPGVNISNYVWDYNDEFDADTVATLTDPTIHNYTSSQDYTVKLYANTSDGCTVIREKTISVGDIPDLALTWRGVCNGEDSEFEIISNFFTNTIALVDQLEWDFGDGNTFSKSSPILADKIVPHQYANTGYFTAQATLTSDLGCTITKSTSVFNVPTKGAITEDLEEFDGAFEDHGWKTGGVSSSWEWGVPATTLFNGDFPGGGAAWVTNLSGPYNANENSWVHSPCYDLSIIERPVISFDYRINTRNPVDGVVLQMNTRNTTDVEADWKVVGSTGSGKNWFNQNGIFANPGNQNIIQTGWSSLKESVWQNAISSLDQELLPLTQAQKKKVRFRFAFASAKNESGGSLPEGFVFDNVKIAERDRIVLLELFTNSGGNNTLTEPNKVANKTINDNFVSETELVKIEYHVGIGGPGVDQLYLDNKKDANARAAYYGVTSTPFAFLDSRNGALGTLFEEQKLASAQATIDTIITHPSIGDSIRVLFTTKGQLPENTVLHIVAVEKNISINAANGETDFTYVMKQMLPNATGTKFPNKLPSIIDPLSDTTITTTVYWPPIAYDENELAIIAFLQNETTREVYQAKILSTPDYIPDVNIITGVEPDFIKQIQVYPNPANDAFTIQLPAALPQIIPVKLYDTYGREVYLSAFENGERSKTITTTHLAAGIYILQLDSKEGALLRKKVLVVH